MKKVVITTLFSSERKRCYLFKVLQREGLENKYATPGFEFIYGEASQEVLTKISQIPGIASVEPVEQRSALSYLK